MDSSIINVVLTILFFIGCTWGQNETLRVYRGHEAAVAEVPYIVSIMYSGMHVCGGSIIDEEWVITAAHCVAHRTDLEIFAGLVELSYPGEHSQEAYVKESFIHPLYDYSKKSITYDVALLHLDGKLDLNKHVAAIDIIDEYELEEVMESKETGIISGWGSNENSLLSNSLFSGFVKLMTEEECSERFESPECHQYQPVAQLCSQMELPISGAGIMDEGGPLVVRNKLVGIILSGKSLRDKTCPHSSSLYASVRYYKEFIEAHIPNILSPDNRRSGLSATLLEIEFVFEVQNATSSIIDKSISEFYNIRAFDYWIGNREDVDPKNQLHFWIQENDHIKTFIINVKVVKSLNNPRSGVTFQLFKNFYITLYVTISHT